MNTLDRKRGTLIGLAVGDALGAAVEFMPPGIFEPVPDYPTGLRVVCELARKEYTAGKSQWRIRRQ